MTSFVYFIQAGPGGPVKIGKADNVEKRATELQTGCPDRLEILGVIECDNARAKEKELHERFDTQRIERSEWFRWSEKIADAVASEARVYESQRNVDVSTVASALGLSLIIIHDGVLSGFRRNASHRNMSAWASFYPWLCKEHNAGQLDIAQRRTCTLHNRARVGDITMGKLFDINRIWARKAFRAQRGYFPSIGELRAALNWSNLDGGPMTTDPQSGRHLTGHGLFVLPGDE